MNGEFFNKLNKNKRLRHTAERFIAFKYYINKGNEQLYWAVNIAKNCVYLSGAWFFIFNNTPPIWFLVATGVSMTVGFTVIGWLWDKFKMFNVEIDFGNARNNFVQKMEQFIGTKGEKK